MQPDITSNSKAPSKTPSKKSPTKEEKEESHRVSKHGAKPHDYVIKDYLQKIAKDPDSVKIYSISDVFYNEKDGWMFLVDWGAKNSFGGMTRDINWFVIDHGTIQLKPEDAYK